MAASVRGLNPYVGPRAFRRGERIFGREQEVNQLVNLIVAERIVLLYSPSGAGKTSLIQASLIPRLLEMKFRVRPVVRVNLIPTPAPDNSHPVNRYIYSALLSLEEETPVEQRFPLERLAAMSLREYLGERLRSDGSRGIDVLIFDQFEEILSLDPTDQDAKREFFTQIGEALEAANLWALFSMREDLVTVLDPYLFLVPSRFSNTFRLDLLGIQAARQAIQQPARLAGVEFEDAAVEKLVDDLRRVRVQRQDGETELQLGPYIEPVQLQVVCYRLWDNRPDIRRIKEEELAAIGEMDQSLVDQSLAEYYAERVRTAATETGTTERSLREWFDQKLITEQGLRGTVLRGAERDGEPDPRAIQLMIDAHLVRAEKRGGATWFELAHDRLIVPVRQNNAGWFLENLNLLQKQAGIWDKLGRPESLLLRGIDLNEAESWASKYPGELLTDEVEFLQACRLSSERERRARQLSRLIAILGVVSMVLAVAAFLAYLDAQEAKVEAQRQARAARSGLLASQSQASMERLPQRGLLLAVEANSILVDGDTGSGSAEQILRAALNNPHGLLLSGHENDVTTLAFSPDGRWLATASNDSTGAAVRLWDMNTGYPAEKAIILHDLGRQVTALAFSPDGHLLATSSDDSSGTAVDLWDLRAQDPAAEALPLGGQGSRVSSLAFSPDGRWLASASLDTYMLLWDLQAGDREDPYQLSGHTSPVQALNFSPDGRWLASGGLDGTVLMWDLRTEDPAADMLSLPRHQRQITSLAFSPDGRWLATGSRDRTVRLWDTESSTVDNFIELNGHDGEVTSLVFSPDKHWLATGSTGRIVMLWDLRDVDQSVDPHPLQGHEASINTLAFSPDSRWLATGSSDHTVRLWDVESPLGAVDSLALRGHDDQVAALSFSPDGHWLASGSYDDSARLWAIGVSGPPSNPAALGAHSGEITALAFSSDGRWLASGSKDNNALLWETGDANMYGEERTLQAHEAAVTTLAFSPDSRWLATGSIDTTARLWDLETTDPVGNAMSLHGHTRWVESLAFSPDSRWLVTASGDGTARLWDLESADPNANFVELLGHEDQLTAVAFSPDGDWLATGSSDRTVRLWKMQSGNPDREGRTLQAHEAAVTTLAFSPDSRWLATGSSDQTVGLWPVTLEELIHLACESAGRNFSQQEWHQFFQGEDYRKTCLQWPEGR